MNWLQNPFANYTKPSMLTASEYKNLIDIKCSSSLKQKFGAEDFDLNNFWIGLQDEYPTIVEKAITILLPADGISNFDTGIQYLFTTGIYGINGYMVVSVITEVIPYFGKYIIVSKQPT
ncbi:hypothetical protein QTP88_000676 [Uroleucon formosanum]